MAKHGTDVRADLIPPLEEAQVSRADLEMLRAWLVGAHFPMAPVVRRLLDSWLSQRDVMAAAQRILDHASKHHLRGGAAVIGDAPLNELRAALAAVVPVPPNEEKE